MRTSASGRFANSADAHVAFEAGNDLALGYARMYGDVTTVEEVRELDDEPWLQWASGNGSQVTYQ